MRNFKRLLATLLAAIMMVTSSGVTALAEGITYDFSTAFIESDSNHLPYVSVDENDDYADGDGITGNHVVTDEKKDHESSNEGYISGNTGGGMGAAGRGTESVSAPLCRLRRTWRLSSLSSGLQMKTAYTWKLLWKIPVKILLPQ